MNKIILSGRLAQDPEMKQTPNGAEMATFSVAVNRKRDRETTDFFRCVCFGQSAKYVTQYGSKGMSLELEGECQLHKYQDRNGTNQTTVNVVVDNLAFTSKNPNQQQSGQPVPRPQQTTPAPQNNGNYQQHPQQQTPAYRNSAPIYQDACRAGQQQNGYTPQDGNYPQPPQYRRNPQQQFMQVPTDEECPFN